MLTEPDALLPVDTETADTGETCVLPVAVDPQGVVEPVVTDTILPQPSSHNVSEEHGDGKNNFLFTVIHLLIVIYILSKV